MSKLVSKDAPIDLPQIGERIAKDEVPALYGSASPRDVTRLVRTLG